jgi:inhibitor of KinA
MTYQMDPGMNPSIQPLGDSAAIVTWPSATDDEIPELIQQLSMSLPSRPEAGIEGIVQGVVSLTLHYDPAQLHWNEVRERIEHSILAMTERPRRSAPVVEIPVCYAAEYAMDLAEVASVHGLTVKDVIRLHSGAEYTVRMIGFAPGFPYLAGLPEQLVTPRRSVPRLRVPAGSVAIGGRQTGVYSLETPGGWQIIGRTPVRLFQPQHDPPCLLSAGDRVRFVPLPLKDFRDQQAQL